MKDKNHFLPLLIDMSDKKVVIFGSGSVGERKAKLFSEYAKVTIVSRSFHDVFYELEEKYDIRLIKADAGKLTDEEINDIIRDAFLVIPATNDRSINERIVVLSKSFGILTNEVDAIGDVTVPAVIKRGGLTISISTTGSSPAFSRFTRQQVEKIITPEFADMIKIQDEMRTYLKGEVPDQKDRKEILWEILESQEVWDGLKESYEKGFNTAQGIVRKKISEKVR
ncbi:precorrin-2 dehydrogenase / sirohydrochlorin ferrochelatase [Methanolobus vulcani]|jgi:precorrin-2 dehydrogenase/sirohydrochlorin ferrochelatase|uniref:precorrin-2 dehydrogenase n=1 Tax=Methanolobus vulcani TaxID=38026 RepID=A0A7Z7FEK1_9EURY|nr:bifunctional precorrin-2 dehydrogenase/sirohydrochlorin ferrochelatase [Methanolobus vulcani]MDK2825052.1 precorrin-2 dehydrogenase [Methanolobus sp.]MDK2947182.1 precorrin-2 dehydrogenase [Methanolobus sp.]SDF88344.1 precorrin-2 dehydrogenase / sirohydrochlorin ferrochelatase [Methanolobus vulcani]